MDLEVFWVKLDTLLTRGMIMMIVVEYFVKRASEQKMFIFYFDSFTMGSLCQKHLRLLALIWLLASVSIDQLIDCSVNMWTILAELTRLTRSLQDSGFGLVAEVTD